MTLFSSLRVRNYRLFASGQLASLTGTWMQRVAQDWLVLELSHTSGTAIGITTGLQFGPILLLGMYGGVIADRYPKRRTLVVTQTAMGLLALALGLLDVTGAARLWHVYLLALLLGVATAIDSPVRQAFVTELVGPKLLPNAVSLNSATFNMARVLGPAVAGVMIAAVGTGWVFLVNAASFLGVLAGLLLMRDDELFVGKRAARGGPAVRAGLAYVRTRPELLMVIVLVGVLGTLGFNFQITTALLAKSTFHRGAASYGLLSTAFAAGALLGALTSARRGEPRQRQVLLAAFAFGGLEFVTGLMPTYWTMFALLLPTGFVTMMVTTAANTLLQLRSSPVMRGRVMALYLIVFMGGTPVGAPLIGWIAEVAGARWSLLVGGLASSAAAVVVAAVLARRTRVTVRAHLLRRHPHLHVTPAPVEEEALVS
jgi:MFS family permease